MIVEPKVFQGDAYPGSRMSEYVKVNDTCYAYAVAIRPDLNNGRSVEWFVEDRSKPCDYFPDLFFRVIRQEASFSDAIAGL